MGIVDEDIERVRAATDLVSLISRHLALKRVGRRHVGLCPFHAEKTPSFSVNGELGLYKCFGCGAAGDAITFVREIEHMDFVGAVEYLAGQANIPLRYTTAGEGTDRKKRSRLLELMGRAVEFYHQRLLESADAAPARSYLRQRGFDGDEVRRYQIGWAPDDWDQLARALGSSGGSGADLTAAGLAFTNKRNRLQDVFRARILFPIFDAQGDAIGFGGRALPGTDGPKYKNSSDSSLYNKSRVLYGLNWAKASIVEADAAVICEGYTDVIGCARAGLPNSVATCGTSLTEDHIKLLRRFGRRVVLAFDADAAGQAAAERIYEWERSHDLDVAVAAMPAGSDPGDLSLSDPEGLRKAIDDAQPFLGFRVARTLEGARLDTPEARARAADAALAVVREHPNEIVRREYAAEVAVRCGLPVDQLVRLANEKGAGRPTPVSVPRETGGRADRTEVEMLRHALFNPEAVGSYLHPELFGDVRMRALYEAVASAESVHDAIAAADERTADLLQRLAMEEPQSDPDDVVVIFVRKAARRIRDELRAETETDPDRFAEIAAQITWLDRMIDSLAADDADQGQQKLDAQQLVAWLTEGG